MAVKGNTPKLGANIHPTLIDDVRKAIGREDISVADLLRAGLYRLLGSSVDEAVEQAKVPMGRPVGSKTRK